MDDQNYSALKNIRILDLSGPPGLYCTKLLADLGAEVIWLEPPGGNAVRMIGPFYKDNPDPEKSLFHFHFNTNKKGITLNIEKEEGREIFSELIKQMDMVIETAQPGYLNSLGLGYDQLKELNPKLIMVSITGFGQTGPFSKYKISDLVALAVGGVLFTMGFPDDPPTSLGGLQAYHMASSNAAIGALIALHYRDKTGEGQWVDIPMQGVVLRMSEMAPFTYWIKGASRGRTGLEYYRSLKDNFPCKDGRVVCSALGGAGADAMLNWMESEGMEKDLRSKRFEEVVKLIRTATIGDKATRRLSEEFTAEVAHIENVWQAFLMTHTREELFVGAQTRGVRLFPVNDAKSIAEDIGLAAREFFVEVDHNELGETITYPGAPYRLSKTPWTINKRAPFIGEHNKEVYGVELGFSAEKINYLKKSAII